MDVHGIDRWRAEAPVVIPHYDIVATLGEGHSAVVYKAYRHDDPDRRPLTLKVFKNIYLSPGQHARLRREVALLRQLMSPYLLPVLGLEEHAGLFMLVSPYTDLRSLAERLATGPLDATTLLTIAIHLARALEDIHRQGVIHGDLKPSNILVDTRADAVKLIDLGLSRIFDQQQSYYPQRLEGSLPYISPEQTGRANRPVDERTDFYSLGVTLFQMATGALPFAARDQLGLIHAHLAVEPPRVASLNPALPIVISDLIGRLMAKNPDDRYQEAAAIRADLERCLSAWRQSGMIVPFPLGQAERRARFSLPHALYGRETELRALRARLTTIGQGSSTLTLIAGAPGIGKSSIVQVLQPDIAAIGGVFVAAKYDQYQRTIPYSALIRAAQIRLRQILRAPDDDLRSWTAVLQQAVGANGQVLCEVLPEVELLLGVQPPAPDLPPQQAQVRFTQTCSAFLRACATPQQPLVIFLDDLQWADDSSLTFLAAFLDDPQPTALLLIGAYRDDEVAADHPLRQFIKRLADAGCPPYQIFLAPLDRAAVQQLLADTLRVALPLNRHLEELVGLLHAKSEGNPFFLGTLLRTLHDDGVLRRMEYGWHWDRDAVDRMRLSDNVVDLVLLKLDSLPATTVRLLQQAACIGNVFPFTTLSDAAELNLDDVLDRLVPAWRAGLILEGTDTSQFAHDRVQEALYSLLDAQSRAREHWRIGQAMLHQYDQPELDEHLFAVVSQLNQGRSLAGDADQSLLLDLNYRAGLKARASAAFDVSCEYFETARALLPADGWQRDYDRTAAIWLEVLTANSLVLRYDAAFDAAAVLEHLRTPLERARCYRQVARLHTAAAKYSEMLTAANQALALLDQPLPDDPARARQAIAEETASLAGRINREALAALPDMTDPAALIQVAVRYEIAGGLYRIAPELFALNNLRLIRAGLKWGIHPTVATGLGGHAVVLITQGQLQSANTLIDISLGYCDRYATAYETAFNLIGGLGSWGMMLPDLAAMRAQNARGQALCRQVGDVLYWGTTLALQLVIDTIESATLPEMLATSEANRDSFFRRYKLDRWEQLLRGGIEFYLKPLLGIASADLQATEQALRDNPLLHFAIFHAYTWAAIVSYTMGNYARALEELACADTYLSSNRIGFINMLGQCYRALALLALDEAHDPATLAQVAALLAGIDRVGEYTAAYRPYSAFVHAELAYAQSEPTWHSRFVAAIEQAAAAGYTLLRGTIHEHMAAHLLAAGHRWGRAHIEESLNLFEQCGAHAKRQQLQSAYVAYFRGGSRGYSMPADLRETTSMSTEGSSSMLQQDLDLYAILKASQTISSEIDFDRVLRSVMQTIGEVSGAQVAYLIMEQAGDLIIQGSYSAAESSAQPIARPQAPLPLGSSAAISEAIVRYVQHTQHPLLLDDASHVGEFADDPAVRARGVRSVLCQPIQEQSRLIGMIYLENNLSTHAFTPERTEVVRLLATQAAISISNAQAVAARAEQERVQRDLEIAYDVQRHLLPLEAPQHPRYDIAGASKAVRQVSGDLYGYYQRPGGGLAVAVGDVTGKGMPAALLMSATTIALAGAVATTASPAATLLQAHRVLAPGMARQQNVAICLVYLDDTQARFVNAGAVAPLVRSGPSTRTLDLGGVPLGTPLTELLPYQEQVVQLQAGDLLVLMTDGVVEATNVQGELFGFERCAAAIAAGPATSARAMLNHLLDAVATFADQAEMQDDVTAVVVHYLGADGHEHSR
jgi:predicted ATPase/serine/threonine protein kinase/serine phosphatase RsbU (regulator of sigma subunit)